MNDEEPKTNLSQSVDLLSCEHLDDEAYCRFHHAVLEWVFAIVKEGRFSLPADLSCHYRGYVYLLNKMYRKMHGREYAEINPVTLRDMYHGYREQTEIHYRLLCRLIASAYTQATSPEERESLQKLVGGIEAMIKQQTEKE